ncbi:hypothetical protein ATY76_29805 [Rhizobium sp. R339]|nr:hypothetical protein ATY76_29805 [Rhizobium sp. R339]
MWVCGHCSDAHVSAEILEIASRTDDRLAFPQGVPTATILGSEGRPGSRWRAAAPDLLHYYDDERGFPVDVVDRRLF